MMFGKNQKAMLPLSFLIILIVLFAFLVGCSGASVDPLATGTGAGTNEQLTRQGEGPGRSLWGFWSGYANTETGIYELTPMRTADAHLNMVPLLNQTAGVIMETIDAESNPAKGLITMRFTLKHPYATAPKYTGFDVRGILITGASKYIASGLKVAGTANPRLLNADGWTRWWNPVEFFNPGYFGYTNGKAGNPSFGLYDATINPYKLFADSLPEAEDQLHCVSVPELNDDNGRAVFRSPQLSRIYRFQFPKGDSYFNYAIDASWAEPMSWPPVVPDNFPPYANCDEAWYVRTHVLNSTLEYVPGAGCTGYFYMYIYVYDWQGRMLNTVNPQVISINIYSKDLLGENVGHTTLSGDTGKQAIYYADISSLCQPAKAGTYELAIEVVSVQGSYKQSWQSAPNAQLAAYTLLSVDVAGPELQLVKKLGIHAYVLRQSNGTSPAATDIEVQQDIDWANTFFSQYGFGIELAQRTFINASEYYNLDPNDSDSLFAFQHDISGLINVYYVRSVIGLATSYATLRCDFVNNWANSRYIVFDSTNCAGIESVLAHELGHNMAILEDTYMLDILGSCSAVAQYHGCSYPSDIYCSPSDKVMGNLMYFGYPYDLPPSSYFLSMGDIKMTTPPIESQAENAVYFHTHFPDYFKGIT